MMRPTLLLAAASLLLSACAGQPPRGTGDMGVVVERATDRKSVV